jgi:hypothetical protein
MSVGLWGAGIAGGSNSTGGGRSPSDTGGGSNGADNSIGAAIGAPPYDVDGAAIGAPAYVVGVAIGDPPATVVGATGEVSGDSAPGAPSDALPGAAVGVNAGSGDETFTAGAVSGNEAFTVGAGSGNETFTAGAATGATTGGETVGAATGTTIGGASTNCSSLLLGAAYGHQQSCLGASLALLRRHLDSIILMPQAGGQTDTTVR